MSGGSFNYKYIDIQETYEGELHDEVLEEMLKDFCQVLHDLEWWQSADYAEGNYRKSVNVFKEKWLHGNKIEGVKRDEDQTIPLQMTLQYVNAACADLRENKIISAWESMIKVSDFLECIIESEGSSYDTN